MANPILVFCEQRDGRLKRVGLEALGQACRLSKMSSSDVVALVVGSSIDSLTQELADHGASRILLAEDSALTYYSSELFTTIVTDTARALEPVAIMVGATSMGKDLAPKLAARLKSALMQDCVALEMETDGSLVATRPIYGGKLRAVVKAKKPIMQVVTLRPNVFSSLNPKPTAAVSVERLTVSCESTRPMARVREIQQTVGGKKELTEATIIVSGGRGLKGPENFKLIEELAAALGAAVGASRAVVDAGWRPHSDQIGLTGKTVSPQLYVACGISGAIQHLAGMSSARTIVAINNNPNAPIFKLATYGIVGDLFEVLPLLTEEVRKLKAG
ncbi:MAG: electron transfer flavoprotein subunit alpha/FixB family protein [Nitrospira sp.]|nr:electron transfer flavoprotein subunit alpha/FixB family protein [Nitrospira sp.]